MPSNTRKKTKKSTTNHQPYVKKTRKIYKNQKKVSNKSVQTTKTDLNFLSLITAIRQNTKAIEKQNKIFQDCIKNVKTQSKRIRRN